MVPFDPDFQLLAVRIPNCDNPGPQYSFEVPMRYLGVDGVVALDFAFVGWVCFKTHFQQFRAFKRADQSSQYLEEFFGGLTQLDIYF